MNDVVREQNHPAPHRRHVSLWTLWFGIFGAPAAWSVQELVSASLSAHACYPYARPLASPLYALTPGIVITGILAFVIALAALIVAWRAWQSTSEESAGDHHRLLEVGEGRTRFMALSGVVVSSIFVINVVLNASTLLMTAPCW